MRSLFITPMLPALSRSDGGGKHRRAGIFLRALARLGSQIDIVCIVPPAIIAGLPDAALLDESQSTFWGLPVRATLVPRRARPQTAWSHYGSGIFDARAQPGLYPYGGEEAAARIGQLLDSAPDIVLVDRIDGVLPILRAGRTPKNLLLDVDDLYHKVRWRAAFAAPLRPGTLITALQVPSLVSLERQAVALSKLAFVCSETDRRHLQNLGFGDRVSVLPNALPVPDAPPGLVSEPNVLYLGSYHHPPNILAAERLARRIWPLVRARVPHAHLLIAGGESHRLASSGAGLPGVSHLGFVDDLDALYARSRLVCCPISTGSGTRLKLLEAAAYARPMISTRIGAEGLDFQDGQQILLRDDDHGLAEACIALLEDDALCARLGSAANAAMRRRYDVRMIEDQAMRMMTMALAA